MDKFFIIDGNSLVFRAYYGVPMLYNSEGHPTNAIFGFMKMLVNLITKHSPKYMAIAFDAGKHTFRHNLYAEYKGTRKPMPEELARQLSVLKNLLKQMNINTIEIPEIEADDIIGSLSKKFDMESILISGDRDLLQLVNPKCTVWLNLKGLNDILQVNEQVLLEKYGVKPYQVVEMKAIMGDSSDNIPGVKGVGEKTALKLIQDYDNLDNIYANIEDAPNRAKNLLIEQKDMAYLSKQLATIKTDCELDYTIEDFTYDFPFDETVKQTFQWLEFRNMSEKEELFAIKHKELDDTKYLSVELNQENIIEYLNKFLNEKSVGLHVDQWQVKFAINECEYDASADILQDEQVRIKFSEFCQSESVEKVVFDTKGLMHQLDNYGICISNFFDISVAQYLCGLLDKDISFKGLCEKNAINELYPSIAVLKLKDISCKKLKELEVEDLYYNLELRLIPVLFEMEKSGITVDASAIKLLGAKYSLEEENLTADIYELAGEEFNIKSPKQMQDILFNKLKLEYKGKKSTNVDVLEALQDQHPIIDKILRYRKVNKIKSTYIDGLLPYIEDGKLHTTFIQTATATGRLSSREPNLQNIPVKDDESKELRKLFTSSFENGQIVSADYSQIELRLVAHFSQDEHMIKSFNENQDIHSTTAGRIFGVDTKDVNSHMRSMAKSVNFGIIYGISEFGLAKNIKTTSKEAKDFIKRYFELYPLVKSYMDENVRIAKERGFSSTLLGRIRYIPELNSSNYNLRLFGERVAMNMPLQGTASDIIKMAMINVYEEMKKRKLNSKLILQIHDELIIDTAPNEVDVVRQILQTEMENVVKLRVPLTVSVSSGVSWFDAK